MIIVEISSLKEFDDLRTGWNEVFASDPHASAFTSWAWLRGWFDVTPNPWTVLAARQPGTGAWLGFLPLSLRGSRNALRLDHLREVHMAGHPCADYTGFVCRPEHEQAVIGAFARHVIEELPWERLRFEEVNDPRMPLFLSHFPQGLSVSEHQGTPCPRLALPDTWDGFLQTLSSATRQSLRSRIKKAEKAFTLTRSNGPDTHGAISGLIQMAVQRTRDNPDPHTWRLQTMLQRCADEGSAHVLMLWQDKVPVAGVSGLIDRKHSSYGMYVTSFNEEFFDFSPGRAALALAIRDAIEMGLKEFDFLRGEEPYKFQFGATSGHNRTVLINRHNLQSAVRRSVSGLRDLLRV